jgi:L-seryl-tRNA(Ser) seleniumtransferase
MSPLAAIPKVDRILALPEAAGWLAAYNRPLVLRAIRQTLDELRTQVRAGAPLPEPAAIAGRIGLLLRRLDTPHLRRVVNGTGTVVNTNLGRSPLPESVARQLLETATRYSNLEFDLDAGERGERYSHVEPLICEITGAEAAIVVNNNAAALLLALASLARGREVIVSRGELVEIGGSFRIPEVMTQSGALLREVGTTNRTHLKDYRDAIGEQTGLLLKVSCSNFAVVGFTAEVETVALAELGRDTGLPLLVDAGSGLMIDLEALAGCGERTVPQYLRDGADVVVCSGDKLLGGPQIGMIVGKKEFIAPMKKHPLLRALRVDKMTLAALEGVLRLYRDERQALGEVPTLRMLSVNADELARRGRSMARRLRRHLPDGVTVTLQAGVSMVGGGALPLVQLPTTLLAVTAAGRSAGDIELAMRRAETPVIGRIARGVFLLDVRTLMDDDLPLVAAALEGLGAG